MPVMIKNNTPEFVSMLGILALNTVMTNVDNGILNLGNLTQANQLTSLQTMHDSLNDTIQAQCKHANEKIA